jgi:hypothetical protein
VGGGVGHLAELQLSRPSNHRFQRLHYLAIARTAVSLRAFFAIPETDSNTNLAVEGDQGNVIQKSFVGAKQWDDTLLNCLGELKTTPRL